MPRHVVAKNGFPTSTAVTNYFSPGGVSSSPATLTAAVGNNAVAALVGACTAATLKTLLTVTGSGVVNYLAAYSGDATSRTHRLKVTADGVVVFDATSSASTTTGAGLVVSGGVPSNQDYAVRASKIYFARSLTIEYASSLTETDKASICYNIHEFQ